MIWLSFIVWGVTNRNVDRTFNLREIEVECESVSLFVGALYFAALTINIQSLKRGIVSWVYNAWNW